MGEWRILVCAKRPRNRDNAYRGDYLWDAGIARSIAGVIIQRLSKTTSPAFLVTGWGPQGPHWFPENSG